MADIRTAALKHQRKSHAELFAVSDEFTPIDASEAYQLMDVEMSRSSIKNLKLCAAAAKDRNQDIQSKVDGLKSATKLDEKGTAEKNAATQKCLTEIDSEHTRMGLVEMESLSLDDKIHEISGKVDHAVKEITELRGKLRENELNQLKKELILRMIGGYFVDAQGSDKHNPSQPMDVSMSDSMMQYDAEHELQRELILAHGTRLESVWRTGQPSKGVASKIWQFLADCHGFDRMDG